MKRTNIRTFAQVLAATAAVGALSIGAAQGAGAAGLSFGTGTPQHVASQATVNPGIDRAIVIQENGDTKIALLNGKGDIVRTQMLGGTDPENIRDVAISPSGEIAAVMRMRDTGTADYDADLFVYESATGNGELVAHYATSVTFSPDGKKIAYTVVSPDGDGDGRGLAAVRTMPAVGGKATTVYSETFTVAPNGVPTQETGGQQVKAWVGGRIVLAWGCCGDQETTLLPATTKTRTLKAVNGWPIGQNKHGSVLVRSEMWEGTNESTLVGVRYQRLNQSGALITLREVRDTNAPYDRAADAQNAAAFGYTLYDPRVEDVKTSYPGQVIKAF